MNHATQFIDGFKAGLNGYIRGRIVTGSAVGNAEFRRGRDAGWNLRMALTKKAIESRSILLIDEYVTRVLAKIEAGDLRALSVEV